MGSSPIESGLRALFEPLLGPVVAFVEAWGWLVIPAGLVFGFVVFSAWTISKGGGQFGIIEGYVGTIGAGKTTLGVQHALELARARGAVLLSNVPIVCAPGCLRQAGMSAADEGQLVGMRDGVRTRMRRPAGCSIEHDVLPMNDDGLDLEVLTRRAFRLRDERRGLVLFMDEVGVIMPARLWKDFSVALMWVLQQSRKLSCEWIWTAQDPSFVDHQLRSLTAAVHYVKAMPPPSIWRRMRGKRPWFMFVSSYTPGNAPRANGEGVRKDKRIGRRFVRYRRRWEASFDTDAVVLPSRHLKGAESIRAGALGDRHAVDMGSGFGPTIEVAEGEPV